MTQVDRYYGWIPSLTGWLSFRSARPYVFKGFRSVCKYSTNDLGQGVFEAIAGRNLNDSSFKTDAEGSQKLIFQIKATRRYLHSHTPDNKANVAAAAQAGFSDDDSFDDDRAVVGGASQGDALAGKINVFLPGSKRFSKLRWQSLIGTEIDRCDQNDSVVTVNFILTRNGSCILKLSRSEMLDDPADSNVGWLVAQCFLALKDYFHTHVAHNNTTDSGVPLVKFTMGRSLESNTPRIAVKMRRRLHRKYSSLLEVNPNAAKSYLLFLKVFVESVGGYQMTEKEGKKFARNPLLRECTYSTAQELANVLVETKRESQREIQTTVFGMLGLAIALLACYFQIIGSVTADHSLLSFSQLQKLDSPNSIYALLFTAVYILTAGCVLTPSRIGRTLDSYLQYAAGTLPFENLKNALVTFRGKRTSTFK